MEKRPITTVFCQVCAAVAVFALTSVTGNAQNLLLNPGFETTTDGVTATYWTNFGTASLVTTNNSLLVVHSGLYSLSTSSAGVTNVLDGSGAYQDVTASPSSNWRLTGYLYVWQNARLYGSNRFAVAQLAFMDNTGGTGNVLQVASQSPHYGNGTPIPVGQWVFFEVDATNAPAGTTHVRTYVLYIGDQDDGGNVYYDDLTLYNPTGSTTAQSVTSTQAVQVSWPMTPLSEGSADYQVQSITNLIIPVTSANSNVLVNPGFEANAVTNDTSCAEVTPITGWTLGGVASYGNVDSGGPSDPNNCYPVHSGIGALSEGANGNPPVVYQSFAATAGQVWTMTGYGFVCENICQVTPDSTMRGLLKIVWNDVNGNPIAPQVDGNFIGGLDTPPYYGITSSPQLTDSSAADTWTLLTCQGTAPTGTVSVVFYNITVGASGQVLFDDDSAYLGAGGPQVGWNNFGPTWLASGGITNSVFDPISTKQKFYRITTP
jgi:hypothetical protein